MLRRTAGEVDAFFLGTAPLVVLHSIPGRLSRPTQPGAISQKEILLHLDNERRDRQQQNTIRRASERTRATFD